jgi:hypothetical protein
VIRKDTTDLLINFGNVYGTALEVLEKREFEIMSIPPRITVPELVKQLFARLGYATWNNPSFSTADTIETLNGLYASRETDKLFVPNEALSQTARLYLKKENIKILSLNEKRLSQ